MEMLRCQSGIVEFLANVWLLPCSAGAGRASSRLPSCRVHSQLTVAFFGIRSSEQKQHGDFTGGRWQSPAEAGGSQGWHQTGVNSGRSPEDFAGSFPRLAANNLAAACGGSSDEPRWPWPQQQRSTCSHRWRVERRLLPWWGQGRVLRSAALKRSYAQIQWKDGCRKRRQSRPLGCCEHSICFCGRVTLECWIELLAPVNQAPGPAVELSQIAGDWRRVLQGVHGRYKLACGV